MKEKQIAYVAFVDLEKGDHRGDRVCFAKDEYLWNNGNCVLLISGQSASCRTQITVYSTKVL